MISGRDKTPEEQDYEDAIEQELDEWDEMMFMGVGHIPGGVPEGWNEQFEAAYVGRPSPKTGDKEISLDHATPEEWQQFLDSLDEDVDG